MIRSDRVHDVPVGRLVKAKARLQMPVVIGLGPVGLIGLVIESNPRKKEKRWPGGKHQVPQQSVSLLLSKGPIGPTGPHPGFIWICGRTPLRASTAAGPSSRRAASMTVLGFLILAQELSAWPSKTPRGPLVPLAHNREMTLRLGLAMGDFLQPSASGASHHALHYN
jgi:hypothetical protein